MRSLLLLSASLSILNLLRFAFWGKKDAISLSLMLRYLVVVLVAEDKCGRAEEQEEQRRQPRRDDFVLLHLRWFCFLRARV
jgi:hypothetical protein